MNTPLRKAIRQRQRPLLFLFIIIFTIVCLLNNYFLYRSDVNLTKLPLFQLQAYRANEWLYLATSNYAAGHNGLLLILSLFWGWLTISWHQQSHFFDFLNSNGYSRKKIFFTVWQETGAPVLYAALIFWATFLFTIMLRLSWHDLGLTPVRLLTAVLFTCLLGQVAWLLTACMALLFGQQFGGLLLTLFAGSLVYFIVSNQLFLVNSDSLWVLIFNPPAGQLLPLLFLLYLLSGGLSLGLSYLQFQTHSAENNGQLFASPLTRWLFSIFIIILLIATFLSTDHNFFYQGLLALSILLIGGADLLVDWRNGNLGRVWRQRRDSTD